MQNTRHTLRQVIRQRRKQLSPTQQKHASIELVSRFSTLPEILTSQHIALYLATDGELETQPLIAWLWQQGKQTYLPVLHPFSSGNLLFLRYDVQTIMTRNKYGIAEPKLNQTLIKPVNELDIICTPLVAFDQTGQRLGMGGGYYDRTLEAWFKTGKGALPIGLAHDCQQVTHLPSEAWDIPLPQIVTPSQIWQWES